MTPVSLMPPVDHCSSCEGQKAARAALQIGEAREQQAELQAAQDPATNPAAAAQIDPGAGINAAAEFAPGAPPVAGAVPALLAPDLAVQASLARPGIDAGATGDAEAQKLRAAQVYRGF